MTPEYDWLFYVAGAALGLAGLWLLYWSLWRDRARGRRRCPKCWYDMSGTPGRVCSECGHQAKRERGLFKTKRRPWWAITALSILVGGYVVAVYPKVTRDQHGWASVTPSMALVIVVPRFKDPLPPWGLASPQPSLREQFSAELSRRIKAKQLRRFESSLLSHACATKLFSNHDVKERWRAHVILCEMIDNCNEITDFSLVARGLVHPNIKTGPSARELIRRTTTSKCEYVDEIAPELARLLATADRIQVRDICELIAMFGSPALPMTRSSLRELLQASEATSRLFAAAALAKLGDDADVVLNTVTDFLSHDDRMTRYVAFEACRALGQRAQPAVPQLIRGLDDEYHGVRWSAAAALGRCCAGDELGLVSLVERLSTEKEPIVRKALTDSLDRLRPHYEDDEVIKNKIAAALDKAPKR